MHVRRHALPCLALALLAACTTAAFATPPDYAATTLTGDWGSARTRLHDAGIELGLAYYGDAAGNLTGGTRHATAYASALDFTGSADFGALFGWRGASLHIELVDFDGTLLDTKANLSSLLNTEQAYVAGNATWVTNFYLEQSLWDGGVDIKYGRMDLETAFFPYACVFQNLNFCGGSPGLMVGGLVAWPASGIGATVTLRPSSRFGVTLGNFAVQPDNLVPAKALKLQNRGRRSGNASVGELDFYTGTSTLPGVVALGAWHDSEPRPDLLLDAAGLPQVLTGAAPLIRSSANGYYVTAHQQVTHTAAGGLTLFASYVRADAKVTYLDSVVQAGVIDAAPFASRPGDVLQFALDRNGVSRDAAEATRLAGATAAAVPGFEYTAELDYNVELHPGVMLMPNVQYTRRPGGTRTNRNYTVLGAQLQLTF